MSDPAELVAPMPILTASGGEPLYGVRVRTKYMHSVKDGWRAGEQSVEVTYLAGDGTDDHEAAGRIGTRVAAHFGARAEQEVMRRNRDDVQRTYGQSGTKAEGPEGSEAG